jgi:hypothetical protein
MVLRLELGIGKAFDDPEPSAIVEVERDGLQDVGFASEELNAEAGRDGDFLQGFLRGEGAIGGLLGVSNTFR